MDATLEEKRQALLRVELRRRREEALRLPRPERRPESPLVPLGGMGLEEPPLFLVHAAGGSVAPYVALAAVLGRDRPVYALEDSGLHDGVPGDRDLAELAAVYLAEVRAVRPYGPLYLGGWSVGGAVALEMARLDGGAALTFLLDTGVADEPSRPGDDELAAWFDADLAAMGAELDEAERARRFPVFAANVRGLLAFRPTRVEGRVVLLCAEDCEPAKLDRWRPYADDVQVVAGDHYTMLQAARAEALAAVMRERFSEVSVR
ncbi:alpha/beta fold hydrolase [Herbidospora sp. NEAU-GS84]|uniref:Alpha/beta fold hydrolase n=1 Tax=Herbidospora solisilvae TaxID=2696284 RepID=A0A7C9J047_9ACTN|nr:alpha/beta fold hydrolase [Herbidospora solisilvae]NAS20502.1 alpha/beta fold hydrolase [Herbidospora solisilvae]